MKVPWRKTSPLKSKIISMIKWIWTSRLSIRILLLAKSTSNLEHLRADPTIVERVWFNIWTLQQEIARNLSFLMADQDVKWEDLSNSAEDCNRSKLLQEQTPESAASNFI